MNESKFKIGFLSFFFFFQGAFLTLMILLGIFNNKIIPTMKEKNTQVELLLKELNRTKYKGHNHSENNIQKSPEKTQYQNFII